jgi:hypothetical protein
MATPFPRLTPPQFGNPANLRFAYPGCQTVIYNRNVMRNGGQDWLEKNFLINGLTEKDEYFKIKEIVDLRGKYGKQ